MNVIKTLENGVLTVSLEGKLDTGTTPYAEKEIGAVLDGTESLVLDMKQLSYISSAGLRLLLSLHKKMAEKGSMKLINVNETNMEIFEFTGFTDILNIE